MTPYPHWVCDAMEKGCRSRRYLPVAETLVATHMLQQTARGAIMGQTAPRDAWTSHLLSPMVARDFGIFNRLEFQDGTRKAPTQDYHGSGRPHTHSVLFGDRADFARLPLPEVLSASPVENSLVEGSVRRARAPPTWAALLAYFFRWRGGGRIDWQARMNHWGA